MKSSEEKYPGAEGRRIRKAAALGRQGLFSEAAVIYRSLAEQGHVDAQAVLGSFYLAGRGVEENQEEAEKWLAAAAANHHTGGQFFLARLYTLQKRDALAFEWMKKSASRDYLPAIFGLGALFEAGIGTPADKERAISLYRKAMEGGHLFAKIRIAALSRAGEFGLWQRFVGVWLLLTARLQLVVLAFTDPFSERKII